MTTLNIVLLSDMWRFNLTNNRWVWIAGSSTTDNVGVYGTKGIEASTNLPGARRLCSLVSDASGVIYIFGGYGYDASALGILNELLQFDSHVGRLNDLWRFNTANNRFTWISGTGANAPGIYGPRGVETSNNVPGGRQGMAAVYHPRTNSIYVFGGSGYDATSSGMLTATCSLLNSFFKAF